jgi:hypothetical protein
MKVEIKTPLARLGGVVAASPGIKGLVVGSEEVGTGCFHFYLIFSVCPQNIKKARSPLLC